MSLIKLKSETEFSLSPLSDPLATAFQPALIRLLVVDDDEPMRKLMSAVLADAGVVSQVAASGREALKMMEAERFDAVISDLAMPGLSGMQLLSEVRRLYPRTAFLIVSGEGDIRIGVQAMREGCDDYIVKPFHLDAVMAAVERALQRRKLEQEVERYRAHLEDIVVDRTLQLRTALGDVERGYEGTLSALGAAIDLRDNETGDHSRRVCLYSIEIAKALGCAEKEIVMIGRGACLHDIGKLAIPDGILMKPGPLTVDERRTMQTHSSIGYDLVHRISFLEDAAEIVLSHHERHNGSGYPHGLRETEIPLGARIFSVADTVDAMTSDRPYRRALPFEDALEEIESEAGQKYDPAVAKAFLGTPQAIWDSIRKGRPKRV
jgi:putative nucleotidyltransferase with HDIG domain